MPVYDARQHVTSTMHEGDEPPSVRGTVGPGTGLMLIAVAFIVALWTAMVAFSDVPMLYR